MAAESGETWDYPLRDDDMDEPPPPPDPTPEEADVDFWAHELPKQFDDVTWGVEVLWHLQHVMRCFNGVRFTKPGPRPSLAQRDTLLRAVARAKVGAMNCLPQSYSREKIETCFEAIATLVIIWAETDAERAMRHPDVAADAACYARALRLDVSSMIAMENVRRRAVARRSQTIAEIWAGAIQRGAA